MTLIMVLVFLTGFISIGVGLVTSDGLMSRLYRDHHDQWEACGRPAGMFRTPQEVVDAPFKAGWASSLATSRVLWRWLFHTPEWARAEPQALRSLRRMRIATLVAHVAVVAWVALCIRQAF